MRADFPLGSVGPRKSAGRRHGASIAIAGLAVALTALAAWSAGEPLVRASVSNAGVQANADTLIQSLSGDGRYLAFASTASNLVTGDANGAVSDIFVRDLVGGTTQLASLNSSGVQANGPSREVVLGEDGRLVAFTSIAANLASDAGNGNVQLFLRDRQAGSTVRLSQTSSGEPANAHVEELDVSPSGSFVVFTSRADNLVAGATSSRTQVFLVNTASGQIERISSTPTGSEGNGDSREAFVSADGRFVAFFSEASNLVEGDLDAHGDVFVRDRQLGVTRELTQGEIQFATHCTDLSANGQYAVFTVPPDASGELYDHIGIADVFNGAVRIVSRGLDQPLDGPSSAGKIDATGQLLAFVSEASNVLPDNPSPDTNGVADVFTIGISQFGAGPGRRIASRTALGGPANGASSSPTISADGNRVAFLSAASNLVSNDTNAREDAFARDRSGETLTRIFSLELVNDGSTGFKAQWQDDNNTETGYEVELAEGEAPFAKVATTGVNVQFKLLPNLKGNTHYRCRVRAFNATDVGPYSPVADGYTLTAAPRNVVANVVPRTTRILVTWQAPVGGAARYEVQRFDGESWIDAQDVLGTDPLQFQDWPSPGGQRHSYRVLALNGSRQRSASSNTASVLALPEAPPQPAVTAGADRVEISWRPSIGATAYHVKRSTTPTGVLTLVSGNVNGTAFTDRTAPPAQALYYVVSALNASGEGPDSTIQSTQSAPAAPTGLQVAAQHEVIHLSWQPSSGATTYTVLRAEKSGGPYLVRKDTVSVTAVTDNGADATTYYYVVQARWQATVGANSQEVAVTTAPGTPGPLTATAGSGKITLTWAAVPGAVGYRLRRNAGSGPITNIGGNLTTTRYVDSAHGGGEKYQYRLIAYNAGGESRDSPIAEATTQAVLKSLTIKPTSVKGGKKVTGTVTLDSPAPVGGSVITLTSDFPKLVKLTASVRVPAGKGSFKFSLKTQKLSKKQKKTTVQITAKLEEKTVVVSLRVKK